MGICKPHCYDFAPFQNENSPITNSIYKIGVTNGSGNNIGKYRIFFEVKSPSVTWKLLDQIPCPSISRTWCWCYCCKRTWRFLWKKYVSTFVRFLSYSPNPTTQFRNHEFWIFIKYWTNKIVWVKKPAYTWKTFVKFLCENSDLKFQNWWLDLMSKNAKSRDNFSGSVWNFPGGSKILNGPLHHFSDFSSCFLAE